MGTAAEGADQVSVIFPVAEDCGPVIAPGGLKMQTMGVPMQLPLESHASLKVHEFPSLHAVPRGSGLVSQARSALLQ
jgi:hypothetical protein